MPSNVVHYCFSDSVLKELKPEIAEIIAKNPRAYYVGAQGPDLLFYLQLEKPPLSRLGYEIHDGFVAEEMFAESAEYAVLHRSDVLKAFLFGQLCHYALDCGLHPYIIKKSADLTDCYKEIEREYCHIIFESAMDYLCIKNRLKKNSRLYRSHKNLKIGKKERAEIARYYSEVVAPMMKQDLPIKTAEKTIKLMKLFLWMTDDIIGIKYLLLRLVEKIMRMPKCLSCFIRPAKERKEEDWQNLRRAPYPVFHNESLMTDKTLDERTAEAKAEAIDMINDFYDSMQEGKKPDSSFYQRNYSGQRKDI